MLEQLAFNLENEPRPVPNDTEHMKCPNCDQETLALVSPSRWTCEQCGYSEER